MERRTEGGESRLAERKEEGTSKSQQTAERHAAMCRFEGGKARAEEVRRLAKWNEGATTGRAAEKQKVGKKASLCIWKRGRAKARKGRKTDIEKDRKG
eukprot:5610717-Pleurochrysis_carterae.AAC.1